MVRSVVVACLIAVLGGCKAYEAHPLDPEKIIGSVDRERRELKQVTSSVSLARAAELMRHHGPDVKEAVARYRTALARARIATPLPNPGLEVGPEYGFGPDVDTNRLVPFGSLGLTIPLGGRLSRTDDLNRARAELLRIVGVARHRELYLELRRRYVRLVIAREIQETREELLRSAVKSVESSLRLVEAGQATALDVALFQLERGRSQAKSLAATAASAEAQAALAALVGVHRDHFAKLPADALPGLPPTLPDLEDLKKLLIANHAELARLRARYAEAESSLRLEIAKQYPDLRLGPSGAGETGDRKTVLGLSIGIAIPIFDRNQQAIAEAEERRAEVRTLYAAAANRALAEVERAHLTGELAANRYGILKKTVLPQARNSIELAREALAAGSGGALRLLDAERSYRQVMIEVLQAGLAEREAWVDLELAVGRPLISFPSETDASPGRTPEALEKNTSGRRGK